MCFAQLVLREVQLCFGNADIRLNARYELIQAAKPHLRPAPSRSCSLTSGLTFHENESAHSRYLRLTNQRLTIDEHHNVGHFFILENGAHTPVPIFLGLTLASTFPPE